MARSPKKYLLLAKPEVTQFTDPTLTAAANSILVSNLKLTPLRTETEARGLVRPYFGNSELFIVGEEVGVTFDVEIAGAGAAGTAPGWGVLLRGCAFAETIDAGVTVAYNPISAAIESLYLKCFQDGVLHVLAGARGNVSFDFAAKTIPHFHFTFTGKYTAPTDTATPSGSVYTAFQTPKPSIVANTGTLTIGGYAAKVSAINADMANEISHAQWMNAESLDITDRKPSGKMTVEAPLLASKDFFALARAGTGSVLTLTHGTVAGNKVKLDAPAVQLSSVDPAEYAGVMAYDLNLTFNPSAGNDELIITAL